MSFTMSSTSSNIVFGIFCGVVGAIGIPGNILVLMVYAPKARKSPSDVIVIWMATLDVITSCVVSIPVSYQLLAAVETEFLCRTLNFLQVASSLVTFQITAVVTVDRFCVICYPHRRLMTKRRANIVIAACCTAGVIAASPLFFLFHVVDIGGAGRKCWPKVRLIAGIVIVSSLRMVMFSALVVLIIVLYSRIAFVIHKQRKINPNTGRYHNRNVAETTASILTRDTSVPTRLFRASTINSGDAVPTTSRVSNTRFVDRTDRRNMPGPSTENPQPQLVKETLNLTKKHMTNVDDVEDNISSRPSRIKGYGAAAGEEEEMKLEDYETSSQSVDSVSRSHPDHYAPRKSRPDESNACSSYKQDQNDNKVNPMSSMSNGLSRIPPQHGPSGMPGRSSKNAPYGRSSGGSFRKTTGTVRAPSSMPDVHTTGASLGGSIGASSNQLPHAPDGQSRSTAKPFRRAAGKLETYDQRVKRKTTRMLVVITILVVVTYAPQVMLPVILRRSSDGGNNEQADDFRTLMNRLMNHATLLNGALDPFIYTFFNSKFRKEVVASWRGLRGVCRR